MLDLVHMWVTLGKPGRAWGGFLYLPMLAICSNQFRTKTPLRVQRNWVLNKVPWRSPCAPVSEFSMPWTVGYTCIYSALSELSVSACRSPTRASRPETKMSGSLSISRAISYISGNLYAPKASIQYRKRQDLYSSGFAAIFVDSCIMHDTPGTKIPED